MTKKQRERPPQETGARREDADRNGDGVRNLVRNDIVGIDDWRQSKVGYLSGYSAAKRAVGNIGSAFGDARSRTSSLLRDLTRSENVPSLANEDGDPAARFEASMKLHRRSERDLRHIVVNSYKTAWLYAWIAAIGIAVAVWTSIYWPPGSLVGLIARLGPLPLVMALFIKHGYTNWIVRRRRLDSLTAYLTSGEILPRKA